MRAALCGSFLLLIVIAHAQMLLIDPLAEDPMALRYNEAFIARNRITRISGQAMVKRDGQPMRDKNERSVQRFDALGHCVLSDRMIDRSPSRQDTSSVEYAQDAHGQVIEEMRNDLNGRFSLRHARDSTGRVTRTTYVRIRADTETVVSDERFTYAVINDTASRMTWLNDLALPYRERTFHADRWGYLRAIDDRYLITGRRSRTTFLYSEKGRLFERTEQTDLTSPSTVKHVWRYDNIGNVTSCDKSRDDRVATHTEYLYEEGTMLLKATLTKDMDTGLIHIVRYTTER